MINVFLLLSFIALLTWAIRHYFFVLPRDEAERLEQLRLKVEQGERVARPLKDYVASLPTKKKSRIAFRIPFIGTSAPSIVNLRRFTALNFNHSNEMFYIRDEQGIVYGPAEAPMIFNWITESRVTAQTLLSNHEAGPWLPAREIRVFSLVFEEEVSSSVRKRFENIKIE